jgi:inhibitor of KinA sporulation pathway (predicted exonuclease)
MAKLLDKILVIDLESTCWEGPPPAGQVSEIIEIGLVVVDVATLTRGEKRSILVKPVKSQVSEFCTRLTTLTADHLKDAGTLADAAKILKKEYLSQERLWASGGDYDRRQFERVCKEFNVGYPFGISHLNVKTLFSVAHGLDREIGLDMAYQRLGLTMEGTHHRGDDDAWNIAGLLCGLLAGARRGGDSRAV